MGPLVLLHALSHPGSNNTPSFFNVLIRPIMGTLLIREAIMNEKELKAIIEKSVDQFEHLRMIEKVQYIMDFGKVYIQYDFCLN